MKVGMVLEGGAMRGLYSAGVLDVLMENNISVDGIIGTSAGALFGVNYFSKQKGRVLRYNKRFCKDWRFISKLSLFLTGNIVNKRFAYYKVTKKLDKFDNEKFLENNKEYYAVATNIETGKSDYIKITDPIKQLEVFRASAAMPVVSRIVKIDSCKYLDGGIGDSIPLKKCQELGFDKIIVILTQPIDYRKEQISDKNIKMVKSRFKKYPKLIDAILNRHQNYNQTIEKIINLEKNGEIFVIRPSKKININVIERNPDKIQEVYDLGQKDAEKIIKQLKKYLEESI
ncbi:MAG: patatin family protein [Firmicutes bacterium]|nr:patatin family protein [Bacillota bacterium]